MRNNTTDQKPAGYAGESLPETAVAKVSRRSVFGLAAGAAGLALTAGCTEGAGTSRRAGLKGNTQAPFKSMRDYMAALDAESGSGCV
jgi:hypothetical protein